MDIRNLVLYHGTNREFDEYDLKYAKPFKDFGKGFYLTTNYAQAQKWAQNKSLQIDGKYAYIYIYQISNKIKKELKQLNCCPEITERVTIKKIVDSIRAIDVYEEDKRREIGLKILSFQEKDKIKRKSQLNKDKRRYQLKQQNRNKENEGRLGNVN